MFRFQGVWLPDGEKHFPEWMQKNGEMVDGKGTYQIKKFRAAMEHVKRFRVAVDVGAHVGLWSMHLAKKFPRVYAFEPVAVFRDCFVKNVVSSDTGQVYIYDTAVGAKPGRVSMNLDPADTGGTYVKGDGEITMVKLDEVPIGDVLDFIKIDVEGHELFVVQGAEEKIRKNKPCLIVEQKPHKLEPNFGLKGTPAVDLLVSWGAKVRKELGGDFILSWD